MLLHYGRVFQNDSRTQSRKRQAGKMVGEGYRLKIWVTDKDRELEEESEYEEDMLDIGLLMIKLAIVGMAGICLIGFGMLFL